MGRIPIFFTRAKLHFRAVIEWTIHYRNRFASLLESPFPFFGSRRASKLLKTPILICCWEEGQPSTHIT
jgi:hypothetical protein